MNTLILQLKKVAPLCTIVFALGCLALLPRAQAVSSPPDGDYSTGDTAQGLGDNTAIDADTLCDMMMLSNTPYGCHALEGNTTGAHNTAIRLLRARRQHHGKQQHGHWLLRARKERHGEQQYSHR